MNKVPRFKFSQLKKRRGNSRKEACCSSSSSSSSNRDYQGARSSAMTGVSSSVKDSNYMVNEKADKKKRGKPPGRTTRTSVYGRTCEEPETSEVFIPSETLVNHAKTLWKSENRWIFQKIHRPESADELDGALELEWNLVSPKTKVKFYTRARYAMLDEDKHSLRRKRKILDAKLNKEEEEQMEIFRRNTTCRSISDIDRFLRLKPARQREHLKKYLMFYQKLLSRSDYSAFLCDFEQALNKNHLNGCDEASRSATSDMEFFHRKILFECLKKYKPNVIHNCREKVRQRMVDMKSRYMNLIWRLIKGEGVEFVPGCRSELLNRRLNELMNAENSGKVDVAGRPRQTPSYTSILSDLELTGEKFQPKIDKGIMTSVPEIVNTELANNILNHTSNLPELPELDLSGELGFGFEDETSAKCLPDSTGDAAVAEPENLDPFTVDLIEAHIRNILNKEANEAFTRSTESVSKSCCDLDSPCCILSIWEASDSTMRRRNTR